VKKKREGELPGQKETAKPGAGNEKAEKKEGGSQGDDLFMN